VSFNPLFNPFSIIIYSASFKYRTYIITRDYLLLGFTRTLYRKG